MAATSSGVNWPAKAEPPSEALTMIVPTPACLARAAIAATLPPSDFETYQIHMTVVSNGESPWARPGLGGLATGAGRRILTGPTGLEAGPRPSATLKRPERAWSGTVTANAPECTRT